jgi:hypothetical protein
MAAVAAAGALGIRMTAMLLVALLCTGGSVALFRTYSRRDVDLVWTDRLRPRLVKRFPALTEDQLNACLRLVAEVKVTRKVCLSVQTL